MMSEENEKGYRYQELPLAVTGVRLTFVDQKFIVDKLGSGKVEPDERCIFLANPEANLWLEVFPRTFFGFKNIADKFDEHLISALCSVEENRLLRESRFKNIVIKPDTGSSRSCCYLPLADAWVHKISISSIVGSRNPLP